MRLYDKIMKTPGTIIDDAFCGAFTHLAKDMKDAQCFQIEPDLASACEEVCMSKPSSMLGALHHLRVPYPKMWIEWQPNDRSKLVHHNDKPAPLRMGCLVSTNKAGNKGIAIYTWEHKITPNSEYDEITLDPFGIIFDWSGETDEPAMVQYAQSVGAPIAREAWEKKYNEDKQAFRDKLVTNYKWANLAKNEVELDAYIELEKCSGIVPLDHCMELFESGLGKRVLRPGAKMYEDFMEDLAGEFAYTEAFLLLLNTRNSVVSQKREDFVRLNKARAKNRKTPIKEFIITNLQLTKVQGNRAAAMGMSREAARLHLVRGHFKTKPSGVYWWSAHVRGGNEDSVVTRKHYKVTA
jgi:hypothetical protein